MSIKRIPILSSTDPESSQGPLDDGAETINCIFDRYPDGRTFATQRAGMTITASPPGGSPEIRHGRGVYYWAKAESFYIMEGGTVQAGYGATQYFIGNGVNKVFFTEVGDYLVLLDRDNNKAWTFNINNPGQPVEITDADFPPNQNPSRQLAGGVVALDGYLFVMDEGGTIWQSALNNPTSWNALDFITAEREGDAGIFLCKHHDQLVAVSSRSIEFFYNAGNATGSVLNRRQDVSYRTGCVSPNSIKATADRVYFIGTEQSGTIGLYSIENFTLNKKSGMSFDKALSFTGLRREQEFFLEFSLLNDHYTVFITAALVQPTFLQGGRYEPEGTFVYDATLSIWTRYTTKLKDIVGFPIVGIADKEQGTDRSVTFLFLNGDLAELTNLFEPIDTIGSSNYFEDDDYIENQPDYIVTVSQDIQETVPMSISTPEWDNGSMTYKYGHSLWVVGSVLSNALRAEDMKVSWSDDHYNTFCDQRDVSVDMNRRLSRLGNFRRRSHKIEYDGPDPLRIEALEMEVRSSAYA